MIRLWTPEIIPDLRFGCLLPAEMVAPNDETEACQLFVEYDDYQMVEKALKAFLALHAGDCQCTHCVTGRKALKGGVPSAIST